MLHSTDVQLCSYKVHTTATILHTCWCNEICYVCTAAMKSSKSGPLIGTGVVIAIIGSAFGVVLIAFVIVAL